MVVERQVTVVALLIEVQAAGITTDSEKRRALLSDFGNLGIDDACTASLRTPPAQASCVANIWTEKPAGDRQWSGQKHSHYRCQPHEIRV
jgi:hypothetical protein